MRRGGGLCPPSSVPWDPQLKILMSLMPLHLTTAFLSALSLLALAAFVALAMILHELGHLAAARLCHVPASEIGLGLGPKLLGLRLRGFLLTLRAIPVASFLRLDASALYARSIPQQLLVHLGGVLINLIAGLLTYGTFFGWINLALAAGNLLPIYKHDGWKCGVVLMRRLLHKESRPVELVFTFSGGVASLFIIAALLHIVK